MTPTRLTTEALAAVLGSATDEARRRGDRHIGSEHLLLGVAGAPPGARLLGIGVDDLRAGLVRLDGQALEAVGVDAALAAPPAVGRHRGRRRRMTHGAKLALGRAHREAKRQNQSSIGVDHLLFGIVSGAPPDPAILLLELLDVDRDDIRALLAGRGGD